MSVREPEACVAKRLSMRACATALWLAGCGLGAPPLDYGDPTEGSEAPQVLTLSLLSPLPLSTLSAAQVDAQIEAAHPSGVSLVEFMVNSGPWEVAVGAQDLYNAPIALQWGPNEVRLRATAEDGTQRLVDTRLDYAGTGPTIVVESPTNGGYAGLQIAVAGRAAGIAPATLAAVEVQVDEGPWAAADLRPDGTFSAAVSGSGGDTQRLRARVTDSLGLTGVVSKRLVGDGDPPTLTLTRPEDKMVTQDAAIAVEGVATDDARLERVEVQVGALGWVHAPVDELGGFSTTVNLAYGRNSLQVRAVDGGGNETLAQREVYRARLVTLTPFDPTEPNILTLTLNQAGLQELIDEEDAKALDMLYLDLSGLLEEALKAMKDYALYGVDTSSWGTAEWNMHAILTMSPDTADVSGTSLEEILTLSQNLGIPVPVVLADLADIEPTQTFLSTEDLAAGVFDNILAPHPGLVTDPADGKKKIPVTLDDAFNDLVTLGTKLGPMGPHPGILFESSPTPVLLPNFGMTVTAVSNLRQHDAVDLSTGKTYLFARKAGEDVLEFDFLDPDWFKVQGLVDEPEIDLSFLITEANGFIPAGTNKLGNPTDGFQRGDSPVWDLPSWRFEHLVADMMFEAYHAKFADTSYTRTFSYDVGALTDAAVIHWDKGWLLISTLAGVGDPPPAQYFWGSVLELAQVRLHDGGIAEGDADLHLQIPGVRVPLTATELVEATRPVLEAQKSKMAEIMIGDLSSYSSEAELFLVIGADDKPYLYFVAANDVPGLAGAHAAPGLYADAALIEKVSSPSDMGSGDSTHEKVAVSSSGGERYYAADLDGSVWKLTMQPMSAGDVKIMIEPGGAW